MIDVTCDCGAVRLRMATPPDEIWACLCQGCQKMGADWAYYHPTQVSVVAAPNATATYQRARRTQDFVFCRTCGCTTHWQSHDPEADTLGVNARLMPKTVRAAATLRTVEEP